MKKIIIFMIIALGVVSCSEIEIKEEIKVEASETVLRVYNDSKDSVLVYLTLGRVDGCVGSVVDVPWGIDTVVGQCGMQGTFWLASGDSTNGFGGSGLGFDGVLSFGYAPDNCASSSYTNGLNQFEFIVNNGFQVGEPQETVDISCVHGVNCVIRVNLPNDNWNAGVLSPIESFANTMNRSEVGIAGVFPYGCDTCTGSKSPPSCIKLPQPSQRQAICNVQRDASVSGGLVQVRYLGKVNILK